MNKKILSSDASAYGFSPENSGKENVFALNKAIKECEKITVSVPGIYDMAGSVRLVSDTHLTFCPGAVLRRTPLENKLLEGNLFVNEGAFSGDFDENISISGAHISVNGVESAAISSDDSNSVITQAPNAITGLRGHISLFYVRNVLIEDITITDLMAKDYGIQVSDFENIEIRRVHIEGLKDGVHLGPGKGFAIRDSKFRTYDDAIALNCADYSVSNPNFGTVSDGVIENCTELPGYGNALFIRILVGTARKWQRGMTVRHSDAVLTQNGMYRVVMKPDGETYISETEPLFDGTSGELDGIFWIKTHKAYKPDEISLFAGCENILCRNIMLEQERDTAVLIYFNRDNYLYSIYPGSELPEVKNIKLENIFALKPVKHILRNEVNE